MKKRLYKSRQDKVLDGVCAGMADYLGMDPTLMRILWVVVTIFLSAVVGGILIYVVCAIIIPREPSTRPKKKVNEKSFSQESRSALDQEEALIEHEATDQVEEMKTDQQDDNSWTDRFEEEKKRDSNGTLIAGIILIGLGIAFLIGNILDFSIRFNIHQLGYYIREVQSVARGMLTSLRGLRDYFLPMLLIGIGLLILVKRK